MRQRKIIGAFLLIFSIYFGNLELARADMEVLSKNALLYKEVMPVAVALKDAIINKRIDILIQYSNPDPLYSYSRYLKDNNSEEYKYLYDTEWNKSLNPNRRSIYEMLTTAKQLMIILEKHELNKRIYVTAYYYDSSKITLKLPLSSRQANLWGSSFATCRFTKTADGWKVAYSIFDYGTDYLVNEKDSEE